VVILDKLINDLKSKIPLGKKTKALDEELDQNEATESRSNASSDGDKTGVTDISGTNLADEGTQSEMSSDVGVENKSLVHKLKKKFEEFQSKKNKSSSDELYPGASNDGPVSDDAAAANAKAKKKRLIIIGVAAILAITFLIPGEEEDTAVPEVAVKLKPRKKPVKPKPKTEETSPDSTSTAATTAPTEGGGSASPSTGNLPGEQASGDAGAAPESTSPDSAVTEATSTETLPVSEAGTTDTTATSTPSIDLSSDEPVSGETPSTDTSVMSTPSSDSIDSVDGTVTTETNPDSITDQILEDLEKQVETKKPVQIKKEYVSPPDYEYFGRGLVYNCAGKHWACVDAPSYKTCEDNSSSVKYLNKKTECHPYNVYETAKGCQNVQNRMVSSSAKTNFCE
jgi:hypothetical protein